MRGFEFLETEEEGKVKKKETPSQRWRRHHGYEKPKEPEKPKLSGRLGFCFDEAEEIAIRRAVLKSKAYMKKYGKGREPFAIDLHRYIGFSREGSGTQFMPL